MKGEAITEVAHDVVAVGPESDDDSCTSIGQDPDGNRAFGSAVFQIRKIALNGPIALETSFDPWAKLATAAVRTWRKEYRCSVLLSKCAV
jgi:hypothetical protein